MMLLLTGMARDYRAAGGGLGIVGDGALLGVMDTGAAAEAVAVAGP